MVIKLVINNKDGKSYKKELADDVSKLLFGKKIGEEINGEVFDFKGYKFLITGGSDNAGFPMLKTINSENRKKLLEVSCTGIRKKVSKTKKNKMTFKGIRVRKTVCGNTISNRTSQLNLKIVSPGEQTIEELTA